MTEFVIAAAAKAAERNKPRNHGTHRGVPSFFRAHCMTAKTTGGGAATYGNAAHELTRHLESLQPYDIATDDWYGELQELAALVQTASGPDVDAVWNWFRRHFPNAMRLVPSRRKSVFVDGVRRAFESGVIEITV